MNDDPAVGAGQPDQLRGTAGQGPFDGVAFGGTERLTVGNRQDVARPGPAGCRIPVTTQQLVNPFDLAGGPVPHHPEDPARSEDPGDLGHRQLGIEPVPAGRHHHGIKSTRPYGKGLAPGVDHLDAGRPGRQHRGHPRIQLDGNDLGHPRRRTRLKAPVPAQRSATRRAPGAKASRRSVAAARVGSGRSPRQPIQTT